MIKFKKIIPLTVVLISIFTFNPISASAEWKQDNNGWWNSEGSSWSVGWKEINGKWYYFRQDGYMAHDTVIDGYELDSDGIWVQNNNSNISNSTDSLEYDSKNDTITVGFKYGDSNDFFVEFQKCGVNNIMAMYNFYKYPINSEKQRVLLKTSNTDWISPYIVKCNNSTLDDGNINKQFTGGWHGSSGEQSGNATATMKEYKVFADGIELNKDNSNIIKSANKIDIKVINDIKAYNTKEAYVLEETVDYNIIGNTINISNDIKALEPCTIYTYYGLETTNSYIYNNSVFYPNGQNAQLDLSKNPNANSGSKKEYPNVNKCILKGSQDSITGFIDNSVGLGNRNYVQDDQPLMFTATYAIGNSKTYSNLIKGIQKDMNKGEVISWKGGYVFTAS